MTRTHSLCAVLTLTAISCGGPTGHIASRPHVSAMQRLVKVLTYGGFLYGIDGTCSEWFAGALPPDARAAERTDDETPAEEAAERTSYIDGRFEARYPSVDGLLYGFDYGFDADMPQRLTLVGRGGSRPAPGVRIIDPETGYVLIGTGAYCVETVDVREDPSDADAVMVGDERWFMSRAECTTSRSAALARKGCRVDAKRTPGARQRPRLGAADPDKGSVNVDIFPLVTAASQTRRRCSRLVRTIRRPASSPTRTPGCSGTTRFRASRIALQPSDRFPQARWHSSIQQKQPAPGNLTTGLRGLCRTRAWPTPNIRAAGDTYAGRDEQHADEHSRSEPPVESG